MEERERTEKAVSGGTEEEEEQEAAGSDGQSAAAVRSKRTRTHRRDDTAARAARSGAGKSAHARARISLGDGLSDHHLRCSQERAFGRAARTEVLAFTLAPSPSRRFTAATSPFLAASISWSSLSMPPPSAAPQAHT